MDDTVRRMYIYLLTSSGKQDGISTRIKRSVSFSRNVIPSKMADMFIDYWVA